jgi:DNA polymerase-3 subunit delta'
VSSTTVIEVAASERKPGWPIWGHDAAVESFSQAIARGRVRHAYAITGPEGVGKSALATAFAQALCCEEALRPGTACGECRSCRKIARGVHPDVQTYSLESQAETAEKAGRQNTSLTIDTVRALSAATALRPMEGRWRIVIVEDAETLQEIAQEALLKTLEEPPSYMVLLLLTNDPDVLLPTIQSRCQRIDLRPVSRAMIVDGLTGLGVPSADAEQIAGLAAGRPGWARQAAADKKLIQQRLDAVEQAVGWIGGSGYERLVTAVRFGDSFTKKREATYETLDTVLGVWRDILLVRAQAPQFLNHQAHGDRLRDLAREWGLAEVHRAVCSVQTCISDLEMNVRPRLAMEAMVLQWPNLPRR